MRLTCGAVVLVLGLLRSLAIAQPSAEDLYSQGQDAFDRGDFATAVAHWNSAYELSRLPLLVFNLGQAYRLSGDCSKALSAYKQFIALDPGAEQRGLADGFVVELSTQCGPRTKAQPVELVVPVVPHVEKHSSTAGNMKVAGLVTGGAGVVVLATGLLFGRRAVSLGDEVSKDCATGCDWSIEKTKESDGKRYATVGKVLDVVGVAAIATGIGLYIYGARQDEPALTVQPHATGATVSWSGRW